MSILTVDQEKCTKCGKCVEVCPTKVIEMADQGPTMVLAERCIACGHCVSICPYAAIDNARNPLAKQTPLPNFPVIPAETAAAFLRSRRSMRCYKKEKVDKAVLTDILNIARFAPTAGNTQGISYVVVQDPQTLQKIIEATVDWMEAQMGTDNPWAIKYQRYVKVFRETGQDVILRGATSIIVATANAENVNGRESAHYCLEYAELYASAVGVGTCWAGYAQSCAIDNYPPVRELLQLPEGTVVAGILLAGYPKYTYKRLPERNPLTINWI